MQHRFSHFGIVGTLLVATLMTLQALQPEKAFAQFPSSMSSLSSSSSMSTPSTSMSSSSSSTASSFPSSSSSVSSSSSQTSSSSSSCHNIVTLSGAGFEAKPVSSKKIAVHFTPPSSIPSCLTLHYRVRGMEAGQQPIQLGTADTWSAIPDASLANNTVEDFTVVGTVSLVDSAGHTVITADYPVVIHPIKPLQVANKSSTFTTISFSVMGGKGPFYSFGKLGFLTLWNRDPMTTSSVKSSDTKDIGTPGCVTVLVWTEYTLNGQTYSDDSIEFSVCTSSPL